MRWWVLAGLVACGGKAEDTAGTATDSLDEAQAACEAGCAVKAQGTACDAAGVERECATFCGFYQTYLGCGDLLLAYHDCEAAIEQWSCEDSYFSLYDVDMPVPEPADACSEELTTANDCIFD